MNFAFTYGSGTTLEQVIAYETAGRLWSSYLTDDVTVNIHVEPSSRLPAYAAGGALMGIEADKPYATWRKHLAADRKSDDDRLVHQSMPSDTNSFTAWVNEIESSGMTSNKLEQSSDTLNLSRANAKALGMRNGQDRQLDGYILINNQIADLGFRWNYDLNGTPPADSVDFFSVAVHEIGHVLGFYSGVDAAGWHITPIDELDDDDDDDDDGGRTGNTVDLDPRRPLDNATSLDMLRFSNEGDLDLVVGGSPFFSRDGGKTKDAEFATGVDRNLGGDGYQASHWRSSGGKLGIMEPDINLGTKRSVTDLDRQAFDIIGWDLGAAGADLDKLQTEAKQALAEQLGVTVEQLGVDPTLVQRLTRDRSQDVASMVDQSQIYEWRRSRSSIGDGWWHEINSTTVSSSTTLELSAGELSAGVGVSIEGDVLTNTSTNTLTNGGQSNPLLSGRSSVVTGSNTLISLNSNSALNSTSLTSLRLKTSTSLGLTPRSPAIVALSPDYLIGSELLGLGVSSSVL